ncbi:MAG TPA: ABC transporter permease, partial [Planctomycetota bacterium]|nr:ABC transporter permease [Planctomycetota bacterium]
MTFTDSVLDALENVRANPLRSFLTMLGVIIGVFAVVALVSIGEGAKKFVTDQFAGLGTNVLIITPGKASTSGGAPITGLGATYKLTAGDAEAIRLRCPAVSHVAPVILASTSTKRGNRRRSDTTVIGSTPEIEVIRNFHVELGQFLPREQGISDKRVCVIGRDVALDLFPSGESSLGQWIKLGEMPFRVIGVMEKKGYMLGFNVDNVIFVPIRPAQELFNTDEMFEVLLQTRSSDSVLEGTEQARQILLRRHNHHEDFTITDQRAMIQAFEKILGVLTYALAGIAAISLLVGGIGIMNIMLVAVGEKTREIGIRKAVGATRAAILGQFLVESLTLSVLGGLIGAAAGIGLGLLLHAAFPSMPVVIQPWTVLVSLGFAIGVGLFFGVYPAKKAAELDPI